MTDPDGNLQLVLSQLLAAQQTIAADIATLRTDVGKALVRIEVIDTKNTDAEQLHRDHETRLRSLEAFWWKLTGIAVLVSVAGGYAGYLAGHVH